MFRRIVQGNQDGRPAGTTVHRSIKCGHRFLRCHHDLRAVALDEEVRLSQFGFALGGTLRGDLLLDQPDARQRIHFRLRAAAEFHRIDQRRGFHKLGNIHRHRLRHPAILRADNHHLAGLQHDGIAEDPVHGKSQAAFEHEHFHILVRQILNHDCRARDRRSHGGSPDARATEPLRHLQQHRATVERHVPRAGFERKQGLCAETCECVVLKKKLGARLDARADGEVLRDDVLQHCRPRAAVLRVHHADVVDDFVNLRLLQRTGEERGRCEYRKRRGGKDGGAFQPTGMGKGWNHNFHISNNRATDSNKSAPSVQRQS